MPDSKESFETLREQKPGGWVEKLGVQCLFRPNLFVSHWISQVSQIVFASKCVKLKKNKSIELRVKHIQCSQYKLF